jgi:UDP-N-acetyl-D-glucosamine dehydrogenase
MNGGVDLSALRLAASLVAKNISPSTLVINESTSFPGTLREVIFPIFQQELSDVSTIHFACSPERVDPGNRDYTFANTPRVVAGLNTESSTLARDFYSLFVDNVEVVDSPEIAELSKLIENSYRLLNISFINELKDFCRKKDIPLMAAIRAASTKPYGFQPFYPSAGAGGHCIPIDPVYLMESAKSLGVEIKTLEAAAHSNRNFPKKVIDVCEEIIGDLQGKVILIEGLAYKADISDVRESAAVALFNELGQRGADVHWRDPMIKSWLIPQTKFEAKEFDLIIVCTIHATSDLNYVTRLDTPVLDLTQRVPKCKNVIPF